MQVFPQTGNDKGISTGHFFPRPILSEEKATRASVLFLINLNGFAMVTKPKKYTLLSGTQWKN